MRGNELMSDDLLLHLEIARFTIPMRGNELLDGKAKRAPRTVYNP